MPKFAAPIANVTVPVGREATLVCVVDDLGTYKEKQRATDNVRRKISSTEKDCDGLNKHVEANTHYCVLDWSRTQYGKNIFGKATDEVGSCIKGRGNFELNYMNLAIVREGLQGIDLYWF
ncbi:Hypothetical protein CINCED_3A012238 [Cinara cedri]|uniref:Uncharacterized protein n=1 Tax=Cinara cedri TaxID=506608 RepID=A0A5E4NLB7_9HEMI|nr:Hypothetical protein CINCED_3A012238 [Cinara cedri]